jgi:hypothetical protein
MINHGAATSDKDFLHRRSCLRRAIAVAGASSLGIGVDTIEGAAAEAGASPDPEASNPADAASEAKKIEFDRTGTGEKVLLNSGFPQTRLSWKSMVPSLSKQFETILSDLPSFGDSGILSALATTENDRRKRACWSVFLKTRFAIITARRAARPRSRSWNITRTKKVTVLSRTARSKAVRFTNLVRRTGQVPAPAWIARFFGRPFAIAQTSCLRSSGLYSLCTRLTAWRAGRIARC